MMYSPFYAWKQSFFYSIWMSLEAAKQFNYNSIIQPKINVSYNKLDNS